MSTYYRIKHDNPSRTSLEDWPYTQSSAPEVQPLRPKPSPTTGKSILHLPQGLIDWLEELNDNDPRRVRYVENKQTGLFNPGFPNMESVTCGGNIVLSYYEKNGWVMIQPLYSFSDLEYLKPLRYETSPQFIHKFTVITRKGTIVNPPAGDIYYPLISRNVLWFPLEKLEPFPTLPLVVTIQVSSGINVRQEPCVEAQKVRAIPWGAMVEIVEYRLIASSVWGRIADGWIVLCYYPSGSIRPWYFTTWYMQTIPPVAPKLLL